MSTKQKLINSGKTKSLYETDNAHQLLVEFRDDATAFNGVKHEVIAGKGALNNQINAHIMQHLEKASIATHFVSQVSPTTSIFQRLKMLPIECVIRNRAAGSLCKRLGIEKARVLDPPLFEFFLKDDALGDPLITHSHILTFGYATEQELTQLEQLTRQVNNELVSLFDKAGLILVDFKLEFGYAGNTLCLGDEISPDGCRIWDKSTQEPLDKDRFRFDLGDLITGYQTIADKLGVITKQSQSAS